MEPPPHPHTTPSSLSSSSSQKRDTCHSHGHGPQIHMSTPPAVLLLVASAVASVQKRVEPSHELWLDVVESNGVA